MASKSNHSNWKMDDVKSYEIHEIPGQRTRTVEIVVTEGALKGNKAIVITMPDKLRGFFPEIDTKIFRDEKPRIFSLKKIYHNYLNRKRNPLQKESQPI
ncbi:hypothetical protein [Desulfofustis glycolicus]|uniref:Uncharacterized protein n=1 Tax=Desulfofustis glycolicus DSM 9705 TaxID=1121409 RepID=A0A1M5W0W4_9BACT|nr:hypothetical protein [Desulfofustis glycolicus]SHH81117.1 hypothetical protein SAMN02745124_02013 [Desulfofustis glycolicus DSM 9705]